MPTCDFPPFWSVGDTGRWLRRERLLRLFDFRAFVCFFRVEDVFGPAPLPRFVDFFLPRESIDRATVLIAPIALFLFGSFVGRLAIQLIFFRRDIRNFDEVAATKVLGW